MGPHVPLYLTDHATRGYRPPARPDYRLSDAEASRHRPHQLMCDSAEVNDARRAAIEARDAMDRGALGHQTLPVRYSRRSGKLRRLRSGR